MLNMLLKIGFIFDRITPTLAIIQDSLGSLLYDCSVNTFMFTVKNLFAEFV